MPARGPDARARRRTSARDLVPGALLGAGAGALGTAVHLSLAPVGGVLVPWGVALALLLAGSTQRWWMRRAAEHGRAPVAAGGAVLLAAFTAASALRWLPGTDRLGLPWSAAVAQTAPTALAASIGWVVGLPVLGVVLLALGARALRPGAVRDRTAAGGDAAGPAAVAPGGRTGESTLGGTPNPVPVREVDGQP